MLATDRVAQQSGEPRGLSSEEAARRLREVGGNVLVPRKRGEGLLELLHGFADPMALMLLGAAVVHFIAREVSDGVALLVAVIPVVVVDVVLELRARGALKKLAQAVAPLARVRRDGADADVRSEELVPGDLLVLREGDLVHADAVVRAAANLAADESHLTGESDPQGKRPQARPEDGNEVRVWAGSAVVSGQGLAEVAETGLRTRFGQIARLVAEAQTGPTPLQQKVSQLVRRLSGVALGVAVGLFFLELHRGTPPTRALLVSLSLAMAAMPEELAIVYTLFLSLGAWRLGKGGVLVRRLTAVETLGSTTVICTDKTGTLTQGRFAVAELVPFPPADRRGLTEAAFLACELAPADPMERAIAEIAEKEGVPPRTLHEGWTLLRDHDFDPEGRHMTHVWARKDGGAERVVVKGALEGVLEHCALAPGEAGRAEAENARLAGEGMRVLAVAGRDGAGADGATRESDERGLTLLGLVAFQDPLRAQVPAAVGECRSAGIHVKVVTGDHPLTALSVARQAGIVGPEAGALTGPQLDALSPEAWKAAVEGAAVLARIRPDQKHALVTALQESGEVVAMTGDGVNDAPALRQADIGLAMGQRGTAVARGAADLVLLHDDFDALVATVREGRRIFVEIQRAFLFLIGFHVPIITLALVAPLAGLPVLLLPVNLVWLELVVHPVSALVFENERPPADLMQRPPRGRKGALVSLGASLASVLSGGVLAAGALLLFWWQLPAGDHAARGAALAALVLGGIALALAELAAGHAGRRVSLPTRLRSWIVLAGVAASVPLGLFVPPVEKLLHLEPPPAIAWAGVAATVVLSVIWRPLWRRRAQ